jgi:hypothetical protein
VIALIGILMFAAAVEDLGQGAWRFLPEVSRYESGPAPKASKRQWIPDGDGVKFLHDGVNATGKDFHTEFRAGYDGKFVPFTGGTLYDSVALHWKNPRRVDQVFTLKGKVTVKATRTISKDGKRMTIDSRGKGFRNLLVYERLVVQ